VNEETLVVISGASSTLDYRAHLPNLFDIGEELVMALRGLTHAEMS
jgi:hypothetical protein